jgi:hypothetical protein
MALALVLALGCGETAEEAAGAGGSAGSGGTAGMGGTTPPPPRVDQTCRDWCANEFEGPSCHQGPFDSIRPCYEGCLSNYQRFEADAQCGDDWVAIKDCELDLECEDPFGDCRPAEEAFAACMRVSDNRAYCEANCPDFDLANCEQDTTECREFVTADSYCGSQCPTQERQECLQQYDAIGTCETVLNYCESECPTQDQQQCIREYESSRSCFTEDATSACRQNCTQQDLNQCVQEWLSTGGRCEFNDGWAACDAYCPMNGNTRSECAAHWDANGTCPPPPPPGCDATACIFCPVEVLDPTVGALFPDGLLAPIEFTATSASVIQGQVATIQVDATSQVGPLPVTVSATLAGTSFTTYSATAGGSGMFEIAVPEQQLTGTTLNIDAGSGQGNVDVGPSATALTIQITEAVFDLTMTSPIELDLTLDASDEGGCVMTGDGVTLPVDAP